MSKYVFDTSALLAYIENEEGAELVENLLMKALEGTEDISISIVSSIEVFYISIQEQGMKTAEERFRLIEDLPLMQEPLSANHIKITGEIKSCKAMSFADSCIAGLAKLKGAILVHKDPEFEQIENEIVQLKLPYKKSIR
jgi:predicted nucleic acid-binding protein